MAGFLLADGEAACAGPPLRPKPADHRPARGGDAVGFLKERSFQRGLAAGITIYAPAIVLSALLGWRLDFTIVGCGLVVTAYTVAGGSEAVSVTQKYQLAVGIHETEQHWHGAFVRSHDLVYAGEC